MNKLKHLEGISNQQIVCFEADANYTKLHIDQNHKVLSSFTLKIHHEQYPNFVRLSRKYVVNPYHISTVDMVKKQILMKNGLHLNVSRRRLDKVLTKISQILIKD